MKISAMIAAVLIFAASESVFAAQCYEGTATVNNATSGTRCTDREKGFSNSSAGPHTHEGCTAAKASARTKLLARLQTSCKPYVQTNAPCRTITINSCG